MSLTPKLAQQIAQDYGNVLEHSAPTFGCVADISELPHSKQSIKDAIIVCLSHIDVPDMREHFKTAYVSLANWQEGVGDSHIGLDMLNMDLSGDVEEQAQRWREQMPEDMDKWNALVSSEMKLLSSELNAIDAVPTSDESEPANKQTRTRSADMPGYDAAGAAASKTAMFTFIATFLYLLFTSGMSPGLLGGTAFFVGGLFASSILIAMPIFLIFLKLRLPLWLFSVATVVATFFATDYAYRWLFG